MLIIYRGRVCISRHTSKKLWLQVHGVEGIDGLVIVRFDLTCQTKFLSASIHMRSPPAGGGVSADAWDIESLPSGISSSPLSVAMIAVGFDENI